MAVGLSVASASSRPAHPISGPFAVAFGPTAKSSGALARWGRAGPSRSSTRWGPHPAAATAITQIHTARCRVRPVSSGGRLRPTCYTRRPPPLLAPPPLLQKTWHPGRVQNLEEVWKREQEAAKEEQKLKEYAKQLQEERAREELASVAQAAGHKM